MDNFYTTETNVQMLIYLMKQHGIKKIIASPGTTNITFVASVQQDPFFEIYSAPDERSAAYMACGLAAESGECVAISCTGATASRNYIPGLTEAYYRKLPVLAITSTQHTGKVGQLVPQVIDRSVVQNDIAVLSVQIPLINSPDDKWDCNVKLNKALLALKHNGGGPVHINLTTAYSRNFGVKELPEYRVITRITAENGEFPDIKVKKVGIFVGAHQKWSDSLTQAVDLFCEKYNGVVFCDHTSNYHGKYGVNYSLVSSQRQCSYESSKMDLLIDMGNVSGAYMSIFPKEVWRVNPDGEIRDTFRKLTYVFGMEEENFFKKYSSVSVPENNTSYYQECKACYSELLSQIPELPFSNAWIAMQTASKIPDGSILHLAILNTLRSWNFFEVSSGVDSYANTGGFGIDGIMSALIGASLTDENKTHFLIIGDLAFFYDMNSLGNRHIGNNVRIMLINNGVGTEFKNYNHFAANFGDDADKYMAASGHYGQKSKTLVKNYAEDLGFEYLCAETKEEYLAVFEKFISDVPSEKPMIFEVFTNSADESDALKLLGHIAKGKKSARYVIRQVAKNIIGENGIKTVKRLIKGI